MYSSVYGPPSGRTYIGQGAARAYVGSATDLGGSPSGSRRYQNGGSVANGGHHRDRYARPPLPTYSMQSASRSSSAYANHNKTPSPDFGNASRYLETRSSNFPK